MTTPAEYRARALAAFMAGKLDEALEAFGAAAAADPADKEALRGLAMVHGQKGELEEAVAWAEKLVAAAPEDTLAYATLSMLLQRQGKIKEAEDAQAKARVLGWKAQLKKPGP